MFGWNILSFFSRKWGGKKWLFFSYKSTTAMNSWKKVKVVIWCLWKSLMWLHVLGIPSWILSRHAGASDSQVICSTLRHGSGNLVPVWNCSILVRGFFHFRHVCEFEVGRDVPPGMENSPSMPKCNKKRDFLRIRLICLQFHTVELLFLTPKLHMTANVLQSKFDGITF